MRALRAVCEVELIFPLQLRQIVGKDGKTRQSLTQQKVTTEDGSVDTKTL